MGIGELGGYFLYLCDVQVQQCDLSGLEIYQKNLIKSARAFPYPPLDNFGLTAACSSELTWETFPF